jgi:hypothetical protein
MPNLDFLLANLNFLPERPDLSGEVYLRWTFPRGLDHRERAVTKAAGRD